ncbi:VOC family protein [uncultured Enterovirga sp.]|uniref:VOC family protein n=1 Tax=uncultured Enterovirga sp. TaxID=2026352 RepID=UPI0035CB4EB9
MDTAEKPPVVEADWTPPPRQEVTGGVAPYLAVDGANAAADFYIKAFAAEDLARMPPDAKGRTMHIHLRINGGSVMLSDAFPEHGCGLAPHGGCVLHIQVHDVGPWWDRAVAAGAKVVVPLADAFWGDRYGQLRDPFGVTWSLASPSKPH